MTNSCMLPQLQRFVAASAPAAAAATPGGAGRNKRRPDSADDRQQQAGGKRWKGSAAGDTPQRLEKDSGRRGDGRQGPDAGMCFCQQSCPRAELWHGRKTDSVLPLPIWWVSENSPNNRSRHDSPTAYSNFHSQAAPAPGPRRCSSACWMRSKRRSACSAPLSGSFRAARYTASPPLHSPLRPFVTLRAAPARSHTNQCLSR